MNKLRRGKPLLNVFPYFPEGQEAEQVESVRKLGETQAMHVEAELLHLLQEGLQFLDCQ